MKYGFVKVAAAVPAVKVADVDYNVQQIESIIAQAEGRGVEVIVFPELCITGYTCQDLFKEQLLLDHAEGAIITLLDFTRKLDIISIIGLPVIINGLLYNCAAVIQSGQLLGIIPKTYLPNYAEFYEKRWFASAQDLNPTSFFFAGSSISVSAEPKLFVTTNGMKFGVEICEDVWAPIPPSNNLALSGADIIFNLSASNELIGKHAYLKSLLAQQSARTISGYVYASSGFGESTQDLVYGGNAMIYENGHLLIEGDRFSIQPQIKACQIDIEKLRVERRQNTTFINAQRHSHALEIPCKPTQVRDFELEREIDPHPFIPKNEDMQSACEEILNIQVAGLAKRLYHINAQKAVIGISGGLDSTLALLVTVKAFDKLDLDRKGIIGITMPGFGTTDRTHNNAVKLMGILGVTIREINIAKAVTQHFEDIGQNPKVHDNSPWDGPPIMVITCRCMVSMLVCPRRSSVTSSPTSLARWQRRRCSILWIPRSLLSLSQPTNWVISNRKQKILWVHTSSTTSSFITSCVTASVQRRSICWHRKHSQAPTTMSPSRNGLPRSVAVSSISSSNAHVCLMVRRWVA